jgi:hypothetical protein
MWKFAVHLKTEEEMLKNPQLRSHGNKVLEAFNASVFNLEKSKAMKDDLFILGTRHHQFGAHLKYFHVK